MPLTEASPSALPMGASSRPKRDLSSRYMTSTVMMANARTTK